MACFSRLDFCLGCTRGVCCESNCSAPSTATVDVANECEGLWQAHGLELVTKMGFVHSGSCSGTHLGDVPCVRADLADVVMVIIALGFPRVL